MASYSALVTKPSLVKPDIYELEEEEIAHIEALLPIPGALSDFWREVGWGFFNNDAEGNFLSSWCNKIMSPEEILDIREGNAFPDTNPFLLGMPFFDLADLMFLVMRLDGSIWTQHDDKISDDLMEFVEALMQNPMFWLDRIPD